MRGFWSFLNTVTETAGKTATSLGVGGIILVLIIIWVLF